jgi:hypothetical protein
MTQENQSQDRYISFIGGYLDQKGEKTKFSFMSDWGIKTFLATVFLAATQGDFNEERFSNRKLDEIAFTMLALGAQRKLWQFMESRMGSGREEFVVDTRPEPRPQVPFESKHIFLSDAVIYGVTGVALSGAAAYSGSVIGCSIAASHFQQARLNYKCAKGQWMPAFKKDIRPPASEIS